LLQTPPVRHFSPVGHTALVVHWTQRPRAVQWGVAGLLQSESVTHWRQTCCGVQIGALAPQSDELWQATQALRLESQMGSLTGQSVLVSQPARQVWAAPHTSPGWQSKSTLHSAQRPSGR
jgi:hypothetical protein